MDTHALIRCFESEEGKRIYSRFLACIEDFHMRPMLERGVLLAFSGGADSVLCAALLLRLKSEEFDFPFLLCHVNHGIRGEDAMRDQLFCESFARQFGLDFCVCVIDVPSVAKEEHLGIEECARKMRYSEFQKIIQGRNDIQTIVTAHNATDNLETIMQRLFRGAGTKGMCGIPALRDNIARPMLYISKKDILNFHLSNDISFVTDKSNFDCSYTRNYIRNEIFPLLERLTDAPEESILRFVQNLREDEECLDTLARDFLQSFPKDVIDREAFSRLPKAVQSRVLSHLVHRLSPEVMTEQGHIEASLVAIREEKRRLSLVGNLVLNCEKGFFYLTESEDAVAFDVALPLNQAVSVEELCATMILCDREAAKTFLNVYKNSIKVNLSSAIIKGEFCVRCRRHGDSYRFGGVTHRLKTLFQSLHLITPIKERIPVFYDEEGIVFVPPFQVRGQSKALSESDADRILLIYYPEGNAPWIDKSDFPWQKGKG